MIHPLFEYARGLLARLAQSGWRPFFGWGGGFMILLALKFAYLDAPRAAIGLSDGYYNGLNILVGLFIGAFIARGVEKQMEQRAPIGPGVGVNPHGGPAAGSV